jgi:hypothetical protein
MVRTHPLHTTNSNSTTTFELLDFLPDLSTIVLIAHLLFLLLGFILTIELYISAFSSPERNNKEYQQYSYLSLQSDDTFSDMDEPHGAYSSSVNSPLTPTFLLKEISCKIQNRRPAISKSETSQKRVDPSEPQAEQDIESLWRRPTLHASSASLDFQTSFVTVKKWLGNLIRFGNLTGRCVDRLADSISVWTRDEGDEQDLILAPSMEDTADSLPI